MATVDIEKFIKDNDLDFTSSDSSLNGNCVVLAGYALHMRLFYFSLLKELLPITGPKMTPEAWKELERVFDYADKMAYGDWWKSNEAKKMYKF